MQCAETVSVRGKGKLTAAPRTAPWLRPDDAIVVSQLESQFRARTPARPLARGTAWLRLWVLGLRFFELGAVLFLARKPLALGRRPRDCSR